MFRVYGKVALLIKNIQGGHMALYLGIVQAFRYIPIMQNQTENDMGNGMKTGFTEVPCRE